VTAAIGRQQLAALRAEFSTVPLVRWPDLGRLLRPGLLVVYLAAAALITAGIPGLPLWPPMILAALGFAAGGVSVAQTLRIRRRRMAALAVIAAGGGAQPALAAAGIVGWSLWLDYDREGFRYRPLDAPARRPRARRAVQTRAAAGGARRARHAHRRHSRRDHPGGRQWAAAGGWHRTAVVSGGFRAAA
jgi:hypothetical protein